jgi:hypothetical protein
MNIGEQERVIIVESLTVPGQVQPEPAALPREPVEAPAEPEPAEVGPRTEIRSG